MILDVLLNAFLNIENELPNMGICGFTFSDPLPSALENVTVEVFFQKI